MAARSKKDFITRGLDWLDNKFLNKKTEGMVDGEKVYSRRKGSNKIMNWSRETNMSENDLMMKSSLVSAGVGSVAGGLASIGTDDSFMGSMVEGGMIGGVAGGFMQRRRSLRTRQGSYADEIASNKGKKVAAGKGSAKDKAIYEEAVKRGDKKTAAKYNNKMNRTSAHTASFERKINSNKYAMETPTINHLAVGLGAGGVTLAHNVLTSNNSI